MPRARTPRARRTGGWLSKAPAAVNTVVGQYASLGTIYAAVNPRIGQIWYLNDELYVVVAYEFVDYASACENNNQQLYNVRVRLKSDIDLFFERYGNQEPMEVRDTDWSK